MIESQAIGQQIRALRLARGLTLAALAELSGVHISTLVRIEQGQIKPHHETVEKLAEAMGLSVELIEAEA